MTIRALHRHDYVQETVDNIYVAIFIHDFDSYGDWYYLGYVRQCSFQLPADYSTASLSCLGRFKELTYHEVPYLPKTIRRQVYDTIKSVDSTLRDIEFDNHQTNYRSMPCSG